jgi:hypothetical protein
VDEFDIVNNIQFLQKNSANQAVEVATGNQSKHVVTHNFIPSPYFPPPSGV